LVGPPELRRQYGRAARFKALAELGERIVIGKTLEVYRELLGPDVLVPAVTSWGGRVRGVQAS
jgi:hypothetical protein